MNRLNFRYLSAKNFLCFGPEGIEIDLTKYNKIVLVRGDNLDVHDKVEKFASNGVGKSSIPEIIVYGIYGKPIKQPKKINQRNLINNKTGKNLYVEVVFDKYRIVRTRKPDTLRFWKSDNNIWDDSTEITLGGMPATQELIEKEIGLTYESFVNISIFTDNNAGSLLESDAATKRAIIENLLSLEKYKKCVDASKAKRNEIANKIKLLQSEQANFAKLVESINKKIIDLCNKESQWNDNKENTINTSVKEIQNKKELILKNSSTEYNKAFLEYEEAQQRITVLKKEYSDLEKLEKENYNDVLFIKKSHEEFVPVYSESLKKIGEINAKRDFIKKEIKSNQDEINSINNNEYGEICKKCYSKIDKNNIEHVKKHIEENIENLKKSLANKEFEEYQEIHDKHVEKNNQYVRILSDLEKKQENFKNKFSTLRKNLETLNSIEKPTSSDNWQIKLEHEINYLSKLIDDKKTEQSPFLSLINEEKQLLKEYEDAYNLKKNEIEIESDNMKYFDFWVRGFGDEGIRKFIVSEIITPLNQKIDYWMSFLINGKIRLQFDDQFEETIERNPVDGDPFVYYTMSGGEKRRINLAVSQAFAYITALNSGYSSSLIFLDEVTTNIDPIGVHSVYNMILELSKDKQVFVTTHDHELLNLLSGYERIDLIKKDGFTTIANN